MLHYKDRTFCIRKCGNKECERNESHIDMAIVSKLGIAVAVADFKNCTEWIKVKK